MDTSATNREAKIQKDPAALISILAAFLVFLLLRLFCFDFIITEGNSMLPSIKSGTILVVNKLSYGLKLPFDGRYLIRWGAPKKGEILVFWTPKGVIAVKRCSRSEAGKWLALGDNAVNSYDSRSYGPLSLDSIIGKAMFL